MGGYNATKAINGDSVPGEVQLLPSINVIFPKLLIVHPNVKGVE